MKHQDLVLSTVQEFAEKLGFPVTIEFFVNYDKEADLYQVLIQTENPGPVIGFHGETLSALQLLISQHLHAKTGEWLNLSLNVNDYRERREVALKSLADFVVEQVLATSTPHPLPPMPAAERRLVHLYLSEHPDVSTTSEGVGKNRYVIISPKTTV